MMVHSDRSCDGKEGTSTSNAENSEFAEPELPVSSSVVELNDQKIVDCIVPKKLSSSESDLRLEHTANLGQAMRNYFMNADNSPLGAKNIITQFNRGDYLSVKRYYILVDRLLEDFREHDYSKLYFLNFLLFITNFMPSTFCSSNSQLQFKCSIGKGVFVRASTCF